MIEVFKTNVSQPEQAQMLIDTIERVFDNYAANFDLEDCDHILRVKSPGPSVEIPRLVRLLKRLGFDAEVLPDEVTSPNVTDIIDQN